jgi:hypothetical protein
MNKYWRINVFSILAFLVLTAACAWAADPPGRVARLQYLTGEVSVQPGGTGEWVAGSVNRPLTIGDNLWADKNSRAELNAGEAQMRVDAESSLTLVNLNDSTLQARLHQGVLNLTVRHLTAGEIYEVDTPNQTFTVQSAGNYRFDVDAAGNAVVTVWKGRGDVTGQGHAVTLKSGERAKFEGTSLQTAINRNPQSDGFDDWCRVRSERETGSASAAYVAPGVIGYEDLDDHGVWTEAPPYGHIWVPVVDAGWEPYRYGHWVWIDPWGWTWVDDAPWGFAPFHYGRWVYWHDRWGWAPGPRYERPFYSPAMVAWFGGGGWGISLGFGGGIFGWCPLGWGEPFHPWYHGDRRYFERINRSNAHIANLQREEQRFFSGGVPVHYANGSHMTAVGAGAMRGSLPVAHNMANVNARELGAHPVNGRLGLTPGEGSRGMTSRAATASGRDTGASPAGMSRGMAAGSSAARAVPRPGSSMGGASSAASQNRSMSGRSVPRPPAGFSANGTARGEAQGRSMGSENRGSSTGRSVPRPSGTVAPAGHYDAPSGGYGRSQSGSASRTASREGGSASSRGSSGRSASSAPRRGSSGSAHERSSGGDRH